MNGANLKVPLCGAFFTLHSHPPWAQMFASRFCFQTLNLGSFLNVRDHVSQPYNTADNIFFYVFQILGEKSRRQKYLD